MVVSNRNLLFKRSIFRGELLVSGRIRVQKIESDWKLWHDVWCFFWWFIWLTSSGTIQREREREGGGFSSVCVYHFVSRFLHGRNKFGTLEEFKLDHETSWDIRLYRYDLCTLLHPYSPTEIPFKWKKRLSTWQKGSKTQSTCATPSPRPSSGKPVRS